MGKTENTYTRIPTNGVSPGYVVCDDCGASADTEEKVQHWSTCDAGESERWRKHYEAGERERRIVHMREEQHKTWEEIAALLHHTITKHRCKQVYDRYLRHHGFNP